MDYLLFFKIQKYKFRRSRTFPLISFSASFSHSSFEMYVAIKVPIVRISFIMEICILCTAFFDILKQTDREGVNTKENSVFINAFKGFF